jgi:hypothetical protein
MGVDAVADRERSRHLGRQPGRQSTPSACGSQLKWVVTSTPPLARTRRSSATVRSTSKYSQHWLRSRRSKLSASNGQADAEHLQHVEQDFRRAGRCLA